MKRVAPPIEASAGFPGHPKPLDARLRRIVLGAGILAAATPLWAAAQGDYPARVIKLVVPLPPGSPIDTAGRLFARNLSRTLGATVIVENKPGAGATLGTAEVARSKPDGYTLLFTVPDPLVSAPFTMQVPYDPQRDFRLVSKVAESISGPVLLTQSTASVNDLAGLIKDARSSSAPRTYASFGPASYPQLILESLARQAGIKLTEVPYRGSPPAMQDLIAGEVNLAFASVENALPHLAAGKIKPIAIVDKSPRFPGVQTFSEAGFDGFVFRSKPWHGLLAPAGTPEAVIQKLALAAKAAANDPGFRKSLEDLGFQAIGSSPGEFLESYRAEASAIPALIKSLGIGSRP